MFSVRLVKCIWTQSESSTRESSSTNEHGTESKVAILERELTLPFAPYPGLVIAGNGWESKPLQSVTWMSSESEFRCTVKDEYPRNAYGSDLSYDFLLKASLREGWHRPEFGGGDAPGQ